MPEFSGTKSHDARTREALGLIVIAAPTSWSNEDCSRIWFELRFRNIHIDFKGESGMENAYRYVVAGPA
jgi:hypothetical protein